jgi:hypothetical protein
MSSSDLSRALLMQHFLQDPMIVLSGMAFHTADTHCTTSKGAVHLVFPVSVNSRAVFLLLCAPNNFTFALCRI